MDRDEIPVRESTHYIEKPKLWFYTRRNKNQEEKESQSADQSHESNLDLNPPSLNISSNSSSDLFINNLYDDKFIALRK